MSNILVVHAHPEPRSFCTALAHTAVEEFKRNGHEVVFTDLYAKEFDAIASSKDFENRANVDYLVYAAEQRQGFNRRTLREDIASEVFDVLTADTVVFVFPLFWFSTPAILKGWIDRVFLSGTFYGRKRVYDLGGMKGKRAMAAITLGGREHMFGERAIHGELATGMLRHFFQGSLGYVGFHVVEPFFAYHVSYCGEEEREKMLENWRSRVSNFEALPIMKMPDISQYDDTLRPLLPA